MMVITSTNNDFGAGEFESVMTLVGDYFDGLHYGDVSRLKTIFHQDAFLKTPGLRRSLENWLDDVASRPVPKQLAASYKYKLVSIEIMKDQAIVKLECPLFEHFYIDYLGLLKEDGHWLIVNKMYTDIEEDH